MIPLFSAGTSVLGGGHTESPTLSQLVAAFARYLTIPTNLGTLHLGEMITE